MKEPKVELTVSDYNRLRDDLKMYKQEAEQATKEINAQKDVRNNYERSVFVASMDLFEKFWSAYKNELGITDGHVKFDNPMYRYSNWYDSDIHLEDIEVDILVNADKHRSAISAYFSRKIKPKDA